MQTIPIERSRPLSFSEHSYRDRVMGCWLGKAVGGTLGMPFEGVDGPLDVSFYEPVPTEMLPNDDLDLQVVWACVLSKMDAPRVDRHILSQAWLDHVEFPWDEYGVAIRNLKNGLKAPLSGSHDNWFRNGMGAPIRSEIWACLAPGNPELAAAYAFEDACVDHADEGIYGETFLAALQSMAFVESDTHVLLDRALATLPAQSLIRRAVEDTQSWWEKSSDWLAIREQILERYGHENFTDAPMNIAFTVLGWLAGEGDFSRAICIANNCGKDTDCTAATVGALMAIIDPTCISESWLTPIGRDLVLSPGITGLNPPATLDDFTELVIELRDRLDGSQPQVEVFDQSTGHLRLSASIAFTNAMPPVALMPSDSQFVSLSGTVANWPLDKFDDEFLLIEYPFRLSEPSAAIVMFNTPQNCRVWVDGEFLFERSAGFMAPSFHRAPAHQTGLIHLEAGEHKILAAVQRPHSVSEAQWVVGVGDAGTKQWIHDAFLQAKSL